MWGLVLSALTIGVSMVVGNKEEGGRGGGNRSESRTANSVTMSSQLMALPLALSQLWSNNDHRRLFLAGTVFGIGCSFLYASLVSYTRLPQRLRLAWNSMWNSSTTMSISSGNAEKNKIISSLRFHAPVLIESLATTLEESSSFIQNNQDGSIQILLSPDHFATSSLTVTLIRIPSGREIPSTRAPGVEFYLVLSAPLVADGSNNHFNDNSKILSSSSAQFSQQGMAETAHLVTNQVFTVEAGHMRWISNAARASSSSSLRPRDLVLLRVTDTVPQWTERIRMDPDYQHHHEGGATGTSPYYYHNVRFTATMDKIRDGIRQLVNPASST